MLATRDGESSKTSATLAALVAACASSDPATRAAAARAVVSLAPSGKGTSKSAVHATWTALAAASARIGDTDHVSTSSARAATSEAMALGLRGDATGDATEKARMERKKLAVEYRLRKKGLLMHFIEG